MTKKDYELIESCFGLNKPKNFPSDRPMSYDEGVRDGRSQMWTDLVYDMANGLARDPKFNRPLGLTTDLLSNKELPMPYSYGEIRKRVEIKLNKEFPNASKEQLYLIRTLAPEIAEGRLDYEEAVVRIEETT